MSKQAYVWVAYLATDEREWTIVGVYATVEEAKARVDDLADNADARWRNATDDDERYGAIVGDGGFRLAEGPEDDETQWGGVEGVPLGTAIDPDGR